VRQRLAVPTLLAVALATLTWVGIVLAAMQVGSPLRDAAAGPAPATPRERAVVGP
jgi:hypothetical protein